MDKAMHRQMLAMRATDGNREKTPLRNFGAYRNGGERTASPHIRFGTAAAPSNQCHRRRSVFSVPPASLPVDKSPARLTVEPERGYL